MKVAIMQPYLFPYIGYFQLVHAVDKFVFYDDVNFIKQGWINRNQVLLNGQKHLFTLPLKNAGSFKLINEIETDPKNFAVWKIKILKTLHQAYSNAPNYTAVKNLVETILDSGYNMIAGIARESVLKTSSYLGLNTTFIPSSSIYQNNSLHSQSRVIDICKKEKASAYINLSGGIELYKTEDFEEHGIQLNFLKPGLTEYKQFDLPFVAGLSIIDVMMFNDRERVLDLLNNYELI